MPFLIRISRLIFFHLNKNVKNSCMKLSTYFKSVFFFYTIFTSSHMKQNHRRKYYILQYSFTCPHTDGQISKFAFKCSNIIRNIEACKSYLISKMSPACIFIFALMKLLLVVWFNFLSLGIRFVEIRFIFLTKVLWIWLGIILFLKCMIMSISCNYKLVYIIICMEILEFYKHSFSHDNQACGGLMSWFILKCVLFKYVKEANY